MKYSNEPSDWYFQVIQGDSDGFRPTILILSMDPNIMDDQLGSHNLPKSISKIIDRCGFYAESELAESCWEVNPEYDHLNVSDFEELLISYGFKKTSYT